MRASGAFVIQVRRAQPGHYHHQEAGSLQVVKAMKVLRQEIMIYFTPRKPKAGVTVLDPGYYDTWVRWFMSSHLSWREVEGVREDEPLHDNQKIWVMDTVRSAMGRSQATCFSKIVQAMEATREGRSSRLSVNHVLNCLTAVAEVVIVRYEPLNGDENSGEWGYKILERRSAFPVKS